MIYNACTNNKRPAGMSLREFIDEGRYFIRALTAHHNIEETWFFPKLATRMPEFRAAGGGGNREAAELLLQHKQIHAGMDVFDEYLRKCRNRELDLEMSVLKEKMDSWGGVLWKHLDQEVKTLGAENMRKHWSLAEMRRLHA
jgi:hemerythrin-like domain-containing protein